MRDKKLIVNARDLRKRQTDAERQLWNHLRGRRLGGNKFRRQHPIGKYIADFICLEKMVIVELDGGQHASDNMEYDRKRDEYLRKKGYKIFRIWNNEAIRNPQGVAEYLESVINDKA